VTVNGGKIYVTATGTAPLGVPRFNANVFPMIYVGDLAERKEDTGAQGTQNLAALVRDNLAETERNFAADLLAIDFAPGTEIAYAVSRAGDVVQRLNFASEPVEFGSNATGVKQIAVGGSLERCLAPNGIVTLHAGGVAWVNCFASFRLAQIAFDTQSVQQLVATASFDTEDPVNLGRRFFHTGNARWSSQAWSSCASCHPNGLSDNVTYQFPAGPRQSTELGGSYLEEDGKLVQRIFNWTGIFDEVHDFMANTTLVQGGARPLFPAEGQDCSGETIGFSAAAQFNAGLAAPMRDVEDTSCNPTDFDDMEAYLKTIRSARGLVRLQPDAVERGREVFVAGGCNDCHGGERTTLSRLFFEPSAELNALLATQEFAPPAAFLPSWSLNRTLQIQIQDPGGATEQAPPQVSCVIRRVGTFGFGTDEEVTSAIEQRGNDAASRAQGEGGYNIPALYGLALGAPFLHHGAARSLDELFRDPAFANHWQAANANFLTGPYADDDRANLIQYLLALDEATPNTHPPAADAGKDACPSVVKL
jgi:cytochrome c peroxidase